MRIAVIRRGLLHMQVCMPHETSDEAAEAFANEDTPTGISSKWRVVKEGADARVQCAECADNVHVIVEC